MNNDTQTYIMEVLVHNGYTFIILHLRHSPLIQYSQAGSTYPNSGKIS